MKKLTEYETPRTDAMRSGIRHPKAAQILLESHGDLERKLRMCRDALAEIFAKTKDLKSYATAKQALDQTK